MGREAIVHAEVEAQADEIRALLESSELILRGTIRRRFSKSAMENVRVEDQALCFTCAGEVVRLHLGASVANAWALAIVTAPPSLRAKLGLDKGALGLRTGTFNDLALEQALNGVLSQDIASVQMIVAYIEARTDLEAALAAHSKRPALPIWTVYRKGKAVPFGDREVRATMRAAGFHDAKSCAVSDRLTATRYHPA